MLDQMAALAGGDGDEGVVEPSQAAVEPSDAVGPAGGVECGDDDRHAGTPSGQAAPEHLVPCADGDDGVDLAIAQQASESRQDSQIEFVLQQVCS